MSPDEKKTFSNLENLATHLKLKNSSPYNSFGKEKKSQPLLLVGYTLGPEQPMVEAVESTINMEDANEQKQVKENQSQRVERRHTEGIQQASAAQSQIKEEGDEGFAYVQVSVPD